MKPPTRASTAMAGMGTPHFLRSGYALEIWPPSASSTFWIDAQGTVAAPTVSPTPKWGKLPM